MAATTVCLIIVNVVIAQLILQAFFPGSGLRLGTAALGALTVLALGCVAYTVMGWRRYLKRPPRGD